MKLKNILTYCIVLYLVTACNSAGDQKTAENASTENEPEMASILNDDGCFEKKMEQWFTKFNQLQNEGHTMDEAHQGAIAWVAIEFKACDLDPVAEASEQEK